MLARVHDESVMERRPKWTIFPSFFPPRGGELGESQARERNNEQGDEPGEDERSKTRYRFHRAIIHTHTHTHNTRIQQADYILFSRTSRRPTIACIA